MIFFPLARQDVTVVTAIRIMPPARAPMLTSKAFDFHFAVGGVDPDPFRPKPNMRALKVVHRRRSAVDLAVTGAGGF